MSRTRIAAALIATAVAAACDDPKSPAQPGYINLALSSYAETVRQDSSIEITATATRVRYTGPITFAVENVPDGVAAVLSDSATGTLTSSVKITLNVGGNAPAGAHAVTVRASGTGIDAATAPIALTVELKSGINIAVADSVMVTQNSTASIPVGIERTDYDGDVELTVSGLPAGVTADLTDSATARATGRIATDSKVLRIVAKPWTAPGDYQLSITGAGEGIDTVTAILKVVIAVPQSVTMDYVSCGDYFQPRWMAIKDGDGSWTAVPKNGSSFTVGFAQQSAALALNYGYMAGNRPVTQTVVLEFSRNELAHIATTYWFGNCNAVPATSKNLRGTVANITLPTDYSRYVQFALGGGFGVLYGNSSDFPTFRLSNVTDSQGDLMAAIHGTGANSDHRMVIMRDIELSSLSEGATLSQLVDFDGPNAFQRTPATVAFSGLAGTENFLFSSTYLTSCNNARYNLIHAKSTNTVSSSITSYTVPSEKRRSGERNMISVSTGDATSRRGGIRSLNDGGETTIDLAPRITATAPVLAGNYQRRQFSFDVGAGKVAIAQHYINTASVYQIIVHYSSPGALGGSGAVLTTPDFSTLEGWDDSWAPPAGTNTAWSVASYDPILLFPSGNGCDEYGYSVSYGSDAGTAASSAPLPAMSMDPMSIRTRRAPPLLPQRDSFRSKP